MERVNQEMETALRCMVTDNPFSWSEQLLWVENAQNSFICSATGFSPFQCCHQYQPPLFPALEKEITCPSAFTFTVVAHGTKRVYPFFVLLTIILSPPFNTDPQLRSTRLFRRSGSPLGICPYEWNLGNWLPDSLALSPS
ncbi:hypothetical protein D4764_19G0001260 [Takifugu flavidus]|uniref:Uncharacterized protein n=1 Tax=Takifugu flavidus TaxID=433684 RepID=A0A5C6NNM5_9TELE|nr:hypothetical protein D4764_19G0001260 [Takifugu flavidus]